MTRLFLIAFIVTIAGATALSSSGGRPAVAAAIVVDSLDDNTLGDNGECTLREAIINANDEIDGEVYTDCATGDPGGLDSISFSVSGTIALSLGEMSITGPLVIDGGGEITIDAGSANRIFNVSAVALSLDGLELVNGSGSDGGAIRIVDGELAITDSTFAGNTASLGGGAIASLDSDLTVSRGSFDNNTAAGSGGAILTASPPSLSTSEGDDEEQELQVAVIEGVTFLANSSLANGGAISNGDADLVVRESTFTGNAADAGMGGAIYSIVGSLSVEDSGFEGNSAEHGGGIASVSNLLTVVDSAFDINSASLVGGGIFSEDGLATIHDVEFIANSAGAGGAFSNRQTDVELTGSAFTGNTADLGGAIYSAPLGYTVLPDNTTAPNHEVSIDGATFTENASTDDGGAIVNIAGDFAVLNSAFNTNSTVNLGGAISNMLGILVVEDSNFTANTAMDGGAIWNENGELTVARSTFETNGATMRGGAIGHDGQAGASDIIDTAFAGNTAGTDGGAYFHDEFGHVLGSTFEDNIAGVDGGGIMSGDELVVTNSTFSDNVAADEGGGLWHGGTLLLIANSTFFENAATTGGGIWDDHSLNVSLTSIANTIVAGSTSGGNCFLVEPVDEPEASNLSDDDTCNGASFVEVADVLLGPLADNGGLTATHLPLEGSPAIDGGDQETCDALALGNGTPPVTADQRGEPRTADGDGDEEAICDVGSVEVEPPEEPEPTPTPEPTETPEPEPEFPFINFAPFAAKDGN